MRILLVSQYFWPESFIINDLAKTLASQGHEITVLTGKPNYPDGNVFDGYSTSGTLREQYVPGVEVFRAPLRPRGKGSAKGLLFNYFSYVWNGIIHFPRAVRGKEFDVIFAFSLSPVTSVIPAIYLKWRLKKHLAVWIQDLWPESLSATGFVRNAFLLRMVGWGVQQIYSASDTLLVQSKAFREPVARYASADKIVYYPNSCSDAPAPHGPMLLPPSLLETLNHSFCVVFAGNLGTAQSMPSVVDAVEQLKHLPNCKIVLVGSGSMSAWLTQQKSDKGLDNLILAGRFPPSQMVYLFARAAALLVTLSSNEIISYTVPSKVQAYLAAGRPIIAALNGEGARIIVEAGAGLSCAAEDPGVLAATIEKLYNMPQERRNAFGRAGRAFFLAHFEMEKQSRNLVEILESRIEQCNGILS